MVGSVDGFATDCARTFVVVVAFEIRMELPSSRHCGRGANDERHAVSIEIVCRSRRNPRRSARKEHDRGAGVWGREGKRRRIKKKKNRFLGEKTSGKRKVDRSGKTSITRAGVSRAPRSAGAYCYTLRYITHRFHAVCRCRRDSGHVRLRYVIITIARHGYLRRARSYPRSKTPRTT